MSGVYVDLISNSGSLHKSDTNSNFTTLIKNPPNLDENKEYLVGLTSLNLPNSFELIDPDSCYFSIFYTKSERDELHVKITTAENFINEINAALQKVSLKLSPTNQENEYNMKSLGDTGDAHCLLHFRKNDLLEKMSEGLVMRVKRKYKLIFKSAGTLPLSCIQPLIEELEPLQVNLTSSGVRSVKAFLREMNKKLKRHIPIETSFFTQKTNGLILYNGLSRESPARYNTNRTVSKITLSEHLATVLGFMPDVVFNEHDIGGDDQFDVRAGFRYAFVYSDIVDHSVVGGGHAPLLDVVPIDVKQDMTCVTPMHITYKRLIRKNLDAITIQISSEVGRMLKYS